MQATNDCALSENGILTTCSECGQRNRLKFERLRKTFRCGECYATMPLPAEPLDVESDASFFAALASSTLPILVDFWAAWCGPCKMVAPEVEKVAGELSGQVLVLKVNTENSPMLAQRYEISGIPTFILFANGQEVGRRSGALPATALKQFATQAF